MKKERTVGWQNILIILITAGLLYAFFGIKDLMTWTEEIDSSGPRNILTGILTPMEALSISAGAEEFTEDIRKDFHRNKTLSLEEMFPRSPSAVISGGRKILSDTKIFLSGFFFPEPVKEISQQQIIPAEVPDTPIEEENISPVSYEMIPDRPSPDVPNGEKLLLLGDSLANSCSVAFLPMVNKMENLEIEKYAKVSANLSNPVFSEWFLEMEKHLANNQYDIVIVMMGANAAQTIMEDGKRWNYGTEGWEKIYRQRARELISVLETASEKIYWIGIPPMMKKEYGIKMKAHNILLEDICRDKNVDFIPVDHIIGKEDGTFTMYKMIQGLQVRIRTPDGIHYSRAGSDLITRYILKEIFPGLELPRSL